MKKVVGKVCVRRKHAGGADCVDCKRQDKVVLPPGTKIDALSALEASFLTLTQQYQQMGEQLKFHAEVLATLRSQDR